jgi:serine O-acetyltransferase
MIQSRDDLRRYIAADLQVRGLQRWRPHYRLTQRISYFQWLLRRAEYWHNCHDHPIGQAITILLRLRLKFLGERLGFSIPLNTFGPGLSIAHVGTIVVNGNARIGARCRLSHGVTIGIGPKGSPDIGDDVWIGPNAMILGRVDVGDGATVRPGAVVVHDVEAGAHVAGVPARRIDEKVEA